MIKKIGIIGSGEMAVILADKAKEMNIESHSFSNNDNDRVIGHSDFHHNIDIFNVDKLVEVFKELEIDGLLPTTELTVSVAAELADILGLIGMPVELAKKVTNKDFVRNNLGKLNYIKQPYYDVYTFKDKLPVIKKYPVIVKPTSLGGKRGITVAKTDKEFQDAISFAKAYSSNNNNKVIIEEFINEGKEYSVESLSYKGKHYIIQITEKIISGIPHCVELGHLQPANLGNNIKDKIIKGIKELLTKIGVDNTATHTEVKVVNDDIYLIELNSRLGGDHISYPLTELSTGYDYIANVINISLDRFQEVNFERFKTSYSGVIFVTTQTKEFESLFKKAENYEWLYKKNKVNEKLETIVNNQAFDTNYMIFNSNKGFPKEVIEILNKKDEYN